MRKLYKAGYSSEHARKELFERVEPHPHHIYILKLEDESGDEWYYVGESSNVTERILTHIRVDGDFESPKDLTITGIKEIRATDNPKEDERETAFEMALDEGTTNILGGK